MKARVLMKLRKMIAIILVCFCSYPAFVLSETIPLPIEVYIYDRPPLFNIKGSDSVTGLVADPTARVFETAKVPFRWRIVSSRAALKQVELDSRPLCATGWFKNTDRERYAKYTLPIYQDRVRVTIVRANDAAVRRHTTFSGLMSDSSLKVGLKKGYSYGSYVDSLLKEKSPRIIMTNQDEEGMVRMLTGKRFDYFMLLEEQAEYLLNTLENSSMITIKRLSDASPGNFRHILCSLKTDDKIIQRLDSAIKALHFSGAGD